MSSFYVVSAFSLLIWIHCVVLIKESVGLYQLVSLLLISISHLAHHRSVTTSES